MGRVHRRALEETSQWGLVVLVEEDSDYDEDVAVVLRGGELVGGRDFPPKCSPCRHRSLQPQNRLQSHPNEDGHFEGLDPLSVEESLVIMRKRCK